MFSFFKKVSSTTERVQKMPPDAVAMYIMKTAGDYTDTVVEMIDTILSEFPNDRRFRNRAVDEGQWLVMACGFIALVWLEKGPPRDVPTVVRVTAKLGELYLSIDAENEGKTPFKPEFIDRITKKLISYVSIYFDKLYERGFELDKFSFQDAANEVARKMVELSAVEGNGTNSSANAETDPGQAADALQFWLAAMVTERVGCYAQALGKYEIAA